MRSSSTRAVSTLLMLGGLGLATITATTKDADAFCGFYVSGADSKMFNDATQVVLMRDGTRTVLSMQNDYKGPPQDFALVVPVPVVLQKENVKTLSPDIFNRVDQLSSPRLVEYWEQDPCQGIGLGSIGTLGHGAGTGTGQGFGSGHGRLGGSVTIEAQFEVGEYEVLILSAKDSGGLDAWLRENKYKIPDGAEPVLKPYVQAGSKFFVAKVNVAKVKFVNGVASLSPIRFHYDTEKFELPVKLGLLNSGGTQDLIVSIIAADRYEVANYPNVTIPTNLDVSESARGNFGAFYASLYDHTLEKNKGAVVTEYSWAATSCDPCPGALNGMKGNDLASLGADVLPSITVSAGMSTGGGVTIRQGATQVTGKLPPEVIQRIVRQNFGRFRLCYENGLKTNPKLSGRVSVKFDISAKGEVQNVKDGGSEMSDPGVLSCVTRAFGNLTFPEPEDKKTVAVVYPIIFNSDGTGVSAQPNISMKAGGQLTLTRLHARYGKESLGSDLVFRKADPIVGGREQHGEDGKLETGVKKQAGGNNFQARYAIRHAWTGPITCKEPQRNIWGGPWPDAGAAPETKAATKIAYAPRDGKLTLSSFTNANVDLTPMPASTPPASPDPSDAAASSSQDGGVDGGASSTVPPASRCGCRVVGGETSSTPSLLAASTLALIWIARKRKRSTH